MTKKYKNVFPIDIFLKQVDKIMQEYDLKTPTDFDRMAGLKNMANRWGKITKSVDTDTLLTIAKRFNKSLDWLVFGKEADIVLQEHYGEIYDARLPAPVETVRLAEVLSQIKSVLTMEKKRLTDIQEARLAALIYEHCSSEKIKPDALLVKRYLLLA